MTKNKVLGASLFLFTCSLAFPAPASAMSTAKACAGNPWCAKEMLAGVKNTVPLVTAKVTIEVGRTKPVSDAAAPVVIVDGQSQADTPVYYWNISLNEQAQALARSKYCGFYPKDPVCLVPLAGGQRSGIRYGVTVLETTQNRNESWYPRRIVTYTGGVYQDIGGEYSNIIIGPITGIFQDIKFWHRNSL
jgi:hypothetical protein